MKRQTPLAPSLKLAVDMWLQGGRYITNYEACDQFKAHLEPAYAPNDIGIVLSRSGKLMLHSELYGLPALDLKSRPPRLFGVVYSVDPAQRQPFKLITR
jgi:hypothetical protein